MNKTEIIKSFKMLHGAEAKEKFLKANNIKFTHDSFYNLIVFAADGTFKLTPEWSK